jgi:NDP-sugar pyrophosphorylase family protein
VIRQGAIIAAGEGSRLRRDGLTMAKPMVPVAGTPLVAHVVGNFLAAGIRSLSVIVHEDERECAEFLRSRFGESASLDVLVKTTSSSLVSFREVLARTGPGRTLVSTVDAFCPAEDFLAFVREAGTLPEDALVLGVTPFVDDEKPLWVRLGGKGRVLRVGGSSGDAVTAGLYVVPERIRALAPDRDFGRLRDFLGWLAEGRVDVFAVTIEKVVDVDRAADLAEAEALVRKGTA